MQFHIHDIEIFQWAFYKACDIFHLSYQVLLDKRVTKCCQKVTQLKTVQRFEV